jgi:glutamine amidotransferase
LIVVIDYVSAGNPNSIQNMLKHIGVDTVITNKTDDIEKADKLILPGIGAFDGGMKKLHDSGLISLLSYKVIEEKTPILGICLGMQLFTRKSEEGSAPGLGWIDAETVRFNFGEMAGERYRIPHMGWNSVTLVQNNPLHQNMVEPRFYFAHSYHVSDINQKSILTTTLYGYEFVSSFAQENIMGVQFHPEKSHKFGMKLLENFVECF